MDKENSDLHSQTHSLQGHFLIATPGMQDPTFASTVIYLCEHTPKGAMGLVVNQTLDFSMKEVFEQFDLNYNPATGKLPLLSGGPVQVNRGFVLHRPLDQHWEATQQIAEDVQVTSSIDIIEDLAADKGPSDTLIALGYSGWGAGQLEEELATSSWLIVPGNAAILFDTPVELRASAAAASIGIRLDQLGGVAGHA